MKDPKDRLKLKGETREEKIAYLNYLCWTANRSFGALQMKKLLAQIPPLQKDKAP